jgi:hypothetical protein
MHAAHFDHLLVARIFMAATLLFLGVFQIAAPRCFWGLSVYFKGAWRLAMPGGSPTLEQARLKRVLEARERAEGDSDAFMRYAGAFTIAMGGVGLIQSVPLVLPYAMSCLGLAAGVIASYLHFRRVTERRVAPLVRRTVWTSLPPLAMLATAICLLGAASFAVYPEFRLGVAIVIVAAVALLGVAWRVATAPAILFGDDSQLEYLVDEHLRFCRAMSLVALACAPPTVLVSFGWAVLPWSARFFNVVTLVVAVAFVIVLVMSLNPMRKRFSLA